MSLEGFIPHLIELRARLLRAVMAVFVAFVCLAPFANRLYHLLATPLLRSLPAGAHMIATEVTTPFLIPLKLSLMAAFLVALPVVLYQIWAFIAPGLYQHEKRLVAPLVVASTVLFYTGMAFAYFLVMPRVFGFITAVAPQGVEVATDIGKYLDFVTTLFLAFGACFEVPVVVILLVRVGLVPLEKLTAIRRYVIVGAFVVAAIVTPPDVLSQTMLAVPMILLYEVGIFVARFMAKKPATAALTVPEAE